MAHLFIKFREPIPFALRTSPLSKHRMDVHNWDDYEMGCSNLAVEGEILGKKVLEAFWIFRRNPVMNNCRSCLIDSSATVPTQCASLASTGC